jgi:hypothetical protein
VSVILRAVKRTETGLTATNQPKHHVWHSEVILLVEFLERGATFNAEQYVQTLKKLIK